MQVTQPPLTKRKSPFQEINGGGIGLEPTTSSVYVHH